MRISGQIESIVVTTVLREDRAWSWVVATGRAALHTLKISGLTGLLSLFDTVPKAIKALGNST